MFAVLCGCGLEPLENGLHEAKRARDGLLAGGDLANAAYTHYLTVYLLLDCAPDLDSFVAEVDAGFAFAHRTGNPYLARRLDGYRRLAAVLRGEGATTAEAFSAEQDGKVPEPRRAPHPGNYRRSTRRFRGPEPPRRSGDAVPTGRRTAIISPRLGAPSERTGLG